MTRQFVVMCFVGVFTHIAGAQPPSPALDRPISTSTLDENRPWIGVSLAADYSGGGALVTHVSPNSPAKRAGVQAGDVILEINGRGVADDQQLIQFISGFIPNTSADLLVYRNGQNIVLNTSIGRKQRRDVDRTTPVALADTSTMPTRDEITLARLEQLGERVYRLERLIEELQREVTELHNAQVRRVVEPPRHDRSVDR